MEIILLCPIISQFHFIIGREKYMPNIISLNLKSDNFKNLNKSIGKNDNNYRTFQNILKLKQ